MSGLQLASLPYPSFDAIKLIPALSLPASFLFLILLTSFQTSPPD
jgi:hypothetical protein